MKTKVKSIFFLFLGHLANDLYPGMVAPLLPIFTARYGWSLAQAGLLITAMQLSCNLSQPIFGIIHDHRPTKSLIWAGLIISGLPFCFVLNITSLGIMIAAMILSGIGVGMFHPAAVVSAGRIADENRKGVSMALFSSGGHVGFMIAPVAAVLIVEVFGDTYMPLIIMPALIMAVFFAYNKGIVALDGHGLSMSEWFSTIFVNGRELFLLWLIASFRAIMHMLIASFLPMLLMARGISYAKSAYLLTTMLFVSMIGMYIGGHLSDIYGRRKMMAITLFCSSPLLYGFLNTSGTLSIVLLLIGSASLASTIPVNIILAQRVDPKLAGMASSLVMGMSFAMGGISATPFGALADRVGIETAMNVPLILPLFGGVTVFFLKKD